MPFGAMVRALLKMFWLLSCKQGVIFGAAISSVAAAGFITLLCKFNDLESYDLSNVSSVYNETS